MIYLWKRMMVFHSKLSNYQRASPEIETESHTNNIPCLLVEWPVMWGKPINIPILHCSVTWSKSTTTSSSPPFQTILTSEIPMEIPTFTFTTIPVTLRWGRGRDQMYPCPHSIRIKIPWCHNFLFFKTIRLCVSHPQFVFNMLNLYL